MFGFIQLQRLLGSLSNFQELVLRFFLNIHILNIYFFFVLFHPCGIFFFISYILFHLFLPLLRLPICINFISKYKLRFIFLCQRFYVNLLGTSPIMKCCNITIWIKMITSKVLCNASPAVFYICFISHLAF